MNTKRPIIKAGMQVRIVFTRNHKAMFPHYCALWEGKTGMVMTMDTFTQKRGFASVYVDGREVCIERWHLRPLPTIVQAP